MNLLTFRTFQYIIVKNTKCALCKETKTENFRTINETTKGKAEEGRCNKVVILVLHIYLYIFLIIR